MQLAYTWSILDFYRKVSYDINTSYPFIFYFFNTISMCVSINMLSDALVP